MMQTDKLFQRMAVRTSLVKNILESFLTICWAFFALFVQVTHYCILTLFTWLALFSWSWTNEPVAPIYYLFLLPWLATPCMIAIQYFLYQKFVKPESPVQQSYAFLNLIVPVRIYLIRSKEDSFNYYLLSFVNICTSFLVSFLFLTIALHSLPSDQNERLVSSSVGHLFVFWLEVCLPLYLLFTSLLFLFSLMFWYLVLSPNYNLAHSMPDYESYQERLGSYPYYWKAFFQSLIYKEIRKSLGTVTLATHMNGRVILNLYRIADKITEKQNERNCSEEYQISIVNQSIELVMYRIKDEVIVKEYINKLVDVIVKTDLSEKDFLSLFTEDRMIRDEKLKYFESSLMEEKKSDNSVNDNISHIQLMMKVFDDFSPEKFARSGFFYSHPRLTGVTVTCFSCGCVLGIKDCITQDFKTKHHNNCTFYCQNNIQEERNNDKATSRTKLWTYSIWVLVQTYTIVSTFSLLSLEQWITAQKFYSTIVCIIWMNANIVLVLSTSIDSSPVMKVFKGIANFFFPVFIVGSEYKMIFFSILTFVSSMTLCLISAFYDLEYLAMVDVRIDDLSVRHWIVISTNLTCITFSIMFYRVRQFILDYINVHHNLSALAYA